MDSGFQMLAVAGISQAMGVESSQAGSLIQQQQQQFHDVRNPIDLNVLSICTGFQVGPTFPIFPTFLICSYFSLLFS